MLDAHQLAPLIDFLHLAIDRLCRHLPLPPLPPSTTHLAPVSKMGRQRIEIHIQAITGEEWEATRGQELSQGVDEQMGHVLCAWTELEDGKNRA